MQTLLHSTTVDSRFLSREQSPSALNVCFPPPQLLLSTNSPTSTTHYSPSHFPREWNKEELKGTRRVVKSCPHNFLHPVPVLDQLHSPRRYRTCTVVQRASTTSFNNEPLQRALAKEEGLGPWETFTCGLWPVGSGNHAAGRSSFLKNKKNKNRKIFQINFIFSYESYVVFIIFAYRYTTPFRESRRRRSCS